MTNLLPAGMRMCSHCGVTHPTTDFYTYGGSKPNAHDLRTYCKTAQKLKTYAARERQRYQKLAIENAAFTSLIASA
jgi:hypothetical protein